MKNPFLSMLYLVGTSYLLVKDRVDEPEFLIPRRNSEDTLSDSRRLAQLVPMPEQVLTIPTKGYKHDLIELFRQNLRQGRDLTTEDIEVIKNTDPEVVAALMDLAIYSMQNKKKISLGIMALRMFPEVGVLDKVEMIPSFLSMNGLVSFHRSELLSRELLVAISKVTFFYPFVVMLPLTQDEMQIIIREDSTKSILHCLQDINSKSEALLPKVQNIRHIIPIDAEKFENAQEEIFNRNK